MNLAQALRVLTTPLSRTGGAKTVAFTGAGGKSTALFQLAREMEAPVVVSATTHLGTWQAPLADAHFIVQTKEDIHYISPQGVILVTGEIKDDRIKGLSIDTISWLREVCEFTSTPLLIEADGSRQKPLKAPAEHEPALPAFVELAVQVAGMTGLGKPLTDTFVHRHIMFGSIGRLEPGETVTPEALIRVLIHPKGGLKNIPGKARLVAVLNQADTPELQAQANHIAKELLSTYHSVVITSLKTGSIHAVRESIAGIILAAGEAQRYGKPKQLLDWRGEPFVRAVAKTATEAGLSPIIVVTGAYAEQVKLAVQDLPVQTVHNEEWHSGQASSIKAGMATITPAPSSVMREGISGGAVFLMADQPQLSPTLLQALVEEHAATLAPIVAPLVFDQRANPVLFDQVTFPDLMKLEGDVGGRGIFSKHKVTYLPWHDDAMLLDVDTPEHYQRLKDLLE